MDLEFLSKIAIPLAAMLAAGIFQLPAMRKGWDEVRHLRHDRRKREADFAAKFFEQCGDPNVKRYAEDLGYAALIGDAHLNTEERRFLLSLKDPERVIDRYIRTFPWVRIYLNQRRLGWKKYRYTSKTYRHLARAGYMLAYVAWAFFAGLPFLLRDLYDPQHKLPFSTLAIPLAYCMSFGVPLAVACIRRSFLLGDAEQLIATQEVADGRDPAIAHLVKTDEGKRHR